MPAPTAPLQAEPFFLDTPDAEEGLPPLTLVIEDPGDDLDDEERAALETLVEASFEASTRGDARPALELLAELRARSSGIARSAETE